MIHAFKMFNEMVRRSLVNVRAHSKSGNDPVGVWKERVVGVRERTDAGVNVIGVTGHRSQIHRSRV